VQTSNDQLKRPQEDMLVSVIIGVYNAEKYLAQTLDSGASQTGLVHGKKNNGIEVILIDDFSKGNSRKIIEQYTYILEQKGFCVRSITHQQNKGTTKSYTEGALMARGKYFKILDHDDLLASERAPVEPVEYMESMETRGCQVGAVFSKSLYIDAQNVVFGEKRFPFPFLPYEAEDGVIAKKWGRFVLAFSPIYPFMHGSSVVRTKCWQELSAGLLSRKNIGLFDVAFAIYAMHSNAWEVAYLRSPSLRYRIHATNFTQGIMDRNSWADILNGYYEEVFPKGLLLAIIKRWNRCIQYLKSSFHRIKGADAFKSIKLFR